MKTIFIVVRVDAEQEIDITYFDKELEAQQFIKAQHDSVLEDYECDGPVFSDVLEDDMAYLEAQDAMEWCKWELFTKEIED